MARKSSLVLAPSYFPEEPSGAARLAYDLAREFARNGYDTWLLTQAHNSHIRPYLIVDGLNVMRYYLKPSIGLDIFRHLRHIQAAKYLLENYLERPPDIIHGNDLLLYIAALRVYRYTSPLTCYSIHSPAVDELPIVWRSQGLKGYLKIAFGLSTIRRYERTALTCSKKIEAKSSFTRDLVKFRYGHNISERIRIIPGWVDGHRFAVLTKDQVREARQRLDWPNNSSVIFILRRLETRMGLDTLLYSLATLKNEGFNFFVGIAGTGKEAESLQRQRRRLNLDSIVRFLGKINEDILPLAYGACDATIIPTRALECFGIIALESMAAGRTTLVTPIGALPELVKPFEPAWIAKGSSEEDITSLLRSFLLGELPSHPAQAISEYAKKRYSFDQISRQYHDFLSI